MYNTNQNRQFNNTNKSVLKQMDAFFNAYKICKQTKTQTNYDVVRKIALKMDLKNSYIAKYAKLISRMQQIEKVNDFFTSNDDKEIEVLRCVLDMWSVYKNRKNVLACKYLIALANDVITHITENHPLYAFIERLSKATFNKYGYIQLPKDDANDKMMQELEDEYGITQEEYTDEE